MALLWAGFIALISLLPALDLGEFNKSDGWYTFLNV